MEQEERDDLKRKVQILEWDKKMGQASFSKEHLLEEYKKKLDDEKIL
ncbi:MAG: hypothetical protein KJ601_08065 [Nanoarchaeota archaeon]|nr:hypothetical protein [Nanoarchaeota archaeon]MBU1704448.1 hypothetical protein [Nanoarchaeota archaeon]